MPPAPGDLAPALCLEGVQAGERGTYSLSDAAGSALVLAFYPGDDTLVCTRQLCAYQDDLGRLAGLGAQVWGISTQDVASHERFAAKRGLTFPLLADPDRVATRAYGVAGPFGRTKRAVFVLDRASVVRWAHVSALGLSYQDADTLAGVVTTL